MQCYCIEAPENARVGGQYANEDLKSQTHPILVVAQELPRTRIYTSTNSRCWKNYIYDQSLHDISFVE